MRYCESYFFDFLKYHDLNETSREESLELVSTQISINWCAERGLGFFLQKSHSCSLACTNSIKDFYTLILCILLSCPCTHGVMLFEYLCCVPLHDLVVGQVTTLQECAFSSSVGLYRMEVAGVLL